MSRTVFIDPETEGKLEERIRRSFHEILQAIEEDTGLESLDELDMQDIAEVFYTNGYIRGAIDAVKDPDFRDDVELINDEIDYQNK